MIPLKVITEYSLQKSLIKIPNLINFLKQNNRISTENGPINVDIANDLYNLAVSYAITKDTNNSFTDMEILTYEITLEDLKKQIDELLKSKSL